MPQSHPWATYGISALRIEYKTCNDAMCILRLIAATAKLLRRAASILGHKNALLVHSYLLILAQNYLLFTRQDNE